MQPSWSWLNTAGSSCGPECATADARSPVRRRWPGCRRPDTSSDRRCDRGWGWPSGGRATGRPPRRSAAVWWGCPRGSARRLARDGRPTTPIGVARGAARRRPARPVPDTPAWHGPPRRRDSRPGCHGLWRTRSPSPGGRYARGWIRAHIGGLVPQLPQRGQHIVAVPGISGVDEHDPAVVGDQKPVHRAALDEMHGLGDGVQHRCHIPESKHRAIASSAKAGRSRWIAAGE